MIFVEDGVASMTTLFQDGEEVEVALAGYESVLGASSMLGTSRSLNRVFMQIKGWGYTTSKAVASEEFRKHGEFERLVLRYTQAQFIQTAQTAACNASHTVRQRLARWLLLCSDRMESDVLELSQEFVGEMLGVRRTSVNSEIGKFQEAGLIGTTRNRIKVLDRPGLEHIACECYGVVRQHLNSYESSDEGFGA
ncbi:Crp/Fnr family transcriptional regulator [Terriglobus sp.]|uniref:Crp/Fnr family transcriptional regulator n=1 Tax=Terriglobus sp. TaxID=1889013 RepID=UPI003AFFF0F5